MDEDLRKASRTDWDPGPLAKQRGWFAAPPDFERRTTAEVAYALDDKFDLIPGLPVYSDGSCFEGTDQYAAAAGSAVVKVQLREGTTPSPTYGAP